MIVFASVSLSCNAFDLPRPRHNFAHHNFQASERVSNGKELFIWDKTDIWEEDSKPFASHSPLAP